MTYIQHTEPTMSKSSKAIKTNEAPQTLEVVQGAPEVKVEPKTINYDYNKLLEEHKTKSGIIRFLSAEGHERGPIAKFMGIKYQFVRNVLITPVKKPVA